jgi:putative transcriptional regulator
MRWRRRRNPVERDLHCRRLFAPSKPGGCELRADFEAMSESLNGRLLIASPSMPDYFHRAVILVVEHSDQGAFGLVLNRPSETTVGDASPELAELIGDDHLIHVGGPVQPNAVTAVGEHSDPADATKLIVGTVGMVDLDDPPELHRLRVFAGYAGWAGGQLDDELEQEAWILDDARLDDPFGNGDLWADVLRRKGGEFALLARMPPDPSVN